MYGCIEHLADGGRLEVTMYAVSRTGRLTVDGGSSIAVPPHLCLTHRALAPSTELSNNVNGGKFLCPHYICRMHTCELASVYTEVNIMIFITIGGDASVPHRLCALCQVINLLHAAAKY